MVAKLIFAASFALGLLGSQPAQAQSDSLLSLTESDVAATNQAMIGSRSKQSKASIRSSKPMIAAPHTAEFKELLVRYSDRKSHTRIELGALGGGRADAPGLVHVGVGMNF